MKSVGCIFIPRGGQPYDLLLKQREDGSFPVAEKLIEMKEYFGFDGYFINQDTSINPEFINNSIFMNYNWNSPDGWNNGDSTNQVYIKKSVEEAKRRGIDPLKTVFSGIEAGMGNFGGTHNSTRNMDVILDPETGNPLTAIASLGGNFVQHALDENLGDPSKNLRGDDDQQWMIAERERMWY